MKTYFKDYKELMKATNEFNKKHWKGNLVVFVASTVIAFAPLAIEKIKNEIEFKKMEKEIEVEEKEEESV